MSPTSLLPTSALCIQEGILSPLVQEGLPLHIPHPLPVPLALDCDGEIDPPPHIRLGIGCEWHPTSPSDHANLLEVRIRLRRASDPYRSAWLAEIASLMTEWIETGARVLVHSLPFEDTFFAERITRHALLGVQSLHGEPLWAHPSAVQAGILPFECPPTQRCTSLGEPTRWRMEAVVKLDPIAPGTGLPIWHLAARDCLRFQKLPLPELGTQILAERARTLCQTGRFQDCATALEFVQREVEKALQAILGFEGLAWPKRDQESGASGPSSQI